MAAAAAEQAAPRSGAAVPVYSERRRTGSAGVRLWPFTLVLAGVLCFVTFYAKGGLTLKTMSTVEIALTLAAGAIVALAAVLLAPAQRRDGFWVLALLSALTILTGLSVQWSVAPGASWEDCGRMLAYTAVFAAAIALVRLTPERWPAILGGVTLAAVVICAYALLTKVFPASLAPSNDFARLEEPFGYWNAVGLIAAIGAIGALWLGARRDGHALVRAGAYPALGLMLLTLVLAYSRGSLLALGAGLLLWFAAVPLRLRGAAVLIIAATGAGAVAAWDFSIHALSSERVGLAERSAAGHRLGALIVAMVLALTCVGIAVGFITARRAPLQIARRRAGAVLLALIAVAILAFAAALAHSHRGFTGSISHAVNSVTDPNAKIPPNTPGRLTAVASERARYWKEALQVFEAHPVLGAGAMGYQTARLRYRTAPLVVAHAHSFLFQTLADLGLIGLALALALFAAWCAAAGRATHPFNRRWSPWRAWRGDRGAGAPGPGWHSTPEPYTAERVGLLSMLCMVSVFGVHSLVDWTWYVPGDAVIALLCAGWLAGRGPLRAAAGPDGSLVSSAPSAAPASGLRARSFSELGYMRCAVALMAVLGALLAAWSQWQPERSEAARQRAADLIASNPRGALEQAELAVSRDPLSTSALATLAGVQQVAGEPAKARATLQRGVREQPSNPQSWLALGRYDLTANPSAAVKELQAAIYLDPESIAPELLTLEHRDPEAIEIYNYYVQALRAAAAIKTVSAPPGPATSGATRRALRRRARSRTRTRTSR